MPRAYTKFGCQPPLPTEFHPVNRETKRKYLELFSQDLSASEALHKYRDYLVEQYGPDEYVKLSGDRSVDPDPQWVFREHSKYILSKYGRLNSPESFQLAESRVTAYNEHHGQKLADSFFNMIVIHALSTKFKDIC